MFQTLQLPDKPDVIAPDGSDVRLLLHEDEAEVPVRSGTCISIPRGTHFQFRSFGPEPLSAIAITMPPWPGEGEALAVPGPWQPSPSA